MQLFTGKNYLKIDIANSFGLDKENWNARLSWFNDNEGKLDELVKEAESPAMFYAGVQAYRKCIAGKESGYPVSLDATASGLQILACMTGDRSAAKLCNVVNTGKREDAYTIVYEEMCSELGEAGNIERDDCKKAIMTSLYGSVAQPKKVFGKGKLYYTFQDTMDKMAPAVWELNKAFLDIWDPEVLEHNWTLPDNFHVKVKVMGVETETVHFLNKPYDTYRKVNMPTEDGRSLGANSTHSVDGYIVREMERRCNFDTETLRNIRAMISDTRGGYKPHHRRNDDVVITEILWNLYKKTGVLSARIFDYLTYDSLHIVDVDVIEELLNTLPPKPFKVITNHDCFRCLPHYANDLRMQYNRQLYELAKSDLLSHILSQMTNSDIKVGKLDETLADDILNADYALS